MNFAFNLLVCVRERGEERDQERSTSFIHSMGSKKRRRWDQGREERKKRKEKKKREMVTSLTPFFEGMCLFLLSSHPHFLPPLFPRPKASQWNASMKVRVFSREIRRKQETGSFGSLLCGLSLFPVAVRLIMRRYDGVSGFGVCMCVEKGG